MTTKATVVDIDEMIGVLPSHEQVLVKRLRALVTECIPHATEKAYHDLCMPFYKKNRLICFIWPPSVQWESLSSSQKRQAKGVALGFNQANLMAKEESVLLAEGRKQVRMAYFKTLDDIDDAKVRALLYEAAMVDEQFAKEKKKR